MRTVELSDIHCDCCPGPAPSAAEIEAQRGAVYGTPIENHERIAAKMTDYLGIEILPSDAAMLMVLVKESRLMQTPDHADSIADRDIYLDFVRRFREAGR